MTESLVVSGDGDDWVMMLKVFLADMTCTATATPPARHSGGDHQLEPPSATRVASTSKPATTLAPRTSSGRLLPQA